LAEALLDAGNDDDGRLGVHEAHLVAAVVRLGAAQIHAAALHLAPWRGRSPRRSRHGAGTGTAPGSRGRRPGRGTTPGRGRGPRPPATSRRRPAPTPTSRGVLLEVDLLAEHEPVDVVAAAASSTSTTLHCRKLPCRPSLHSRLGALLSFPLSRALTLSG
jgi:hypothetical protein